MVPPSVHSTDVVIFLVLIDLTVYNGWYAICLLITLWFYLHFMIVVLLTFYDGFVEVLGW